MTPHIGQKELYVTSGHYEKYGEDSFQSIKTPKINHLSLLKNSSIYDGLTKP